MLLVVAVVVAIGAAGYFGLSTLLGGKSPQSPGPVVASIEVAGTDAAWSSADNDRCKARARAAANADGSANEIAVGSAMPANPAVTGGYAGLSTMLECKMTTKTGRLCDTKEKAALVADINDYLGRTDLVTAGLAVQGAPMQVMGGLFGGEMSAGSDIYNMERDATLAFMKRYQGRITSAARRLARDGLLAPSDFAGFLGGTPEVITRIFGNVVAERNACIRS
ncbi:MAG: hypothetical protein ABI697_11010 [Devosia sp.]